MKETRGIVLGLGNILNRDEGLGVYAQKMLKDRVGGRTGIEILDGGVLGLDLLPLVATASHLLVLDAVDAGMEPGGLVELRGDEVPRFSKRKLSQHQLAFEEVLGLAAVRGGLPEHIRLCGLQPGDISPGLGLSREVESAMPLLVERAEAVLRSWRLL